MTSKESLPFCLLLMALVATIMTVVVAAEQTGCSEVVGPCGPYCNVQCLTAHPGGVGKCETSPRRPGLWCRCYFQCEPPPMGKICDTGLGQCNEICNLKCCIDKCGSKFPGGIGSCIEGSCHCNHPCS
ncbi:hypothetical protein L6164_034228 [Bauhinia variegata]|uniref:Uncharacterized protein n=1 Tax=Bauhinia variegata TaxID=167791 RepID=A0ACB9KUY2_BAUVA|nr:hypothetical protein L6164_034228 [Bauhinia variegata]